MKRPERPPEGASAAEIAAWMEEDFGWALATAPVDESESTADETDAE